MNPEAAARQIRLLLLDVDGVLTDGRLYYGNHGEELKAFHIQDGLGIKLLQRQGIAVGIITGRTSKLLERRTAELGIELVIQGREDKSNALNEMLKTHPLPLEQIAFMGDDLPDLPVMARVGLALTVANCSTTVAHHAHWQATRGGGEGAVREAAEFILAAQGKLDAALASYLAGYSNKDRNGSVESHP
ncbi:MAG: 3-deoxy-D-manno-octulosonate 8-phosphate phosphatase [Gammaproteobacteria bacterium BRH_c0]|nr:MAG: 3-deoxy-D-manno-octulosonate 8-phosphate phosphatase [Gammaproteobacteria bacterium BRH_c0]